VFHTGVLTEATEAGKGQENAKDFTEVPASVEEGDILLFTNMGTFEPDRDFDAKYRNSVPEYYMHARSMCQVKI